MPRILFVCNAKPSFVQTDLDLLRERHDVEEYVQPGRVPRPALLRALARSDLVVGWFASWHTFPPLALSPLFRKPALLVVGGFDTAAVPEIGYGYQRGGPARWLSRFAMRRASVLVTHSEHTRDEVERHAGIPRADVRVVHLGVPDRFGENVEGPREALALTVGNVARISLERKGFRAFVEAARYLPDVEFVVGGAWLDGAVEALRERAGPNVRFTGRLSDEELGDLYRRAGAYVQPSRHEGFGLAVAEAMLAGSIPVVTRAGSLPEVAGEEGVYVEADPAAIAEGVREALALGEAERRRCRARVLERFPLEARRRALHELVDALLR